MIYKSNILNNTKKEPISVIIPTIGRPDDLSFCLLSLAKQTFLPAEVIVVDNSDKSSSDEIKKILYKKSGNNLSGMSVIYVREKRKGISYARNRGIKEAENDLIAFIDDDCMAEKHWIEEISIAAKKYPGSLFYGKNLNGSKENIYSCLEHFATQNLFGSGIFNDGYRKKYSLYLDTKNAAIKKSVIKNVRFDNRFNRLSDVDFSLELRKKKKEIMYNPKMVVSHFGRKKLTEHIKREFAKGRGTYQLKQKWRNENPDNEIWALLDKRQMQKFGIVGEKLKSELLSSKNISFRIFFNLLYHIDKITNYFGYYYGKISV